MHLLLSGDDEDKKQVLQEHVDREHSPQRLQRCLYYPSSKIEEKAQIHNLMGLWICCMEVSRGCVKPQSSHFTIQRQIIGSNNR